MVTMAKIYQKSRASPGPDFKLEASWPLDLTSAGWQELRESRSPERSGSSTNPNIRYFVAKLSIVAIYAPFERLS